MPARNRRMHGDSAWRGHSLGQHPPFSLPLTQRPANVSPATVERGAQLAGLSSSSLQLSPVNDRYRVVTHESSTRRPLAADSVQMDLVSALPSCAPSRRANPRSSMRQGRWDENDVRNGNFGIEKAGRSFAQQRASVEKPGSGTVRGR